MADTSKMRKPETENTESDDERQNENDAGGVIVRDERHFIKIKC